MHTCAAYKSTSGFKPLLDAGSRNNLWLKLTAYYIVRQGVQERPLLCPGRAQVSAESCILNLSSRQSALLIIVVHVCLQRTPH